MNLNEEIICGHLVTTRQKKINAVFLDLLREFDYLCTKSGITWWLIWGALIGAVRHRGFIPWDDDVDIAVPRKDFDRLMRMTNEDFDARPPYFLQNPVTDPHCIQMLLRFRRSDTTSIRSYDVEAIRRTESGAPYNLGLSLAIVPLDIVPRSGFVYAVQKRIRDVLYSVQVRAFRPADEKPVRHVIARTMIFGLGPRRFAELRHWPFRWCRKNRSGLVHLMGDLYEGFCTTHPAEDFASTVLLPFEDIVVPVPIGYRDFLIGTYGDYMQFPPPEQRRAPHGAYERADTPYTVSVERFRCGEIDLPAADQPERSVS